MMVIVAEFLSSKKDPGFGGGGGGDSKISNLNLPCNPECSRSRMAVKEFVAILGWLFEKIQRRTFVFPSFFTFPKNRQRASSFLVYRTPVTVQTKDAQNATERPYWVCSASFATFSRVELLFGSDHLLGWGLFPWTGQVKLAWPIKFCWSTWDHARSPMSFSWCLTWAMTTSNILLWFRVYRGWEMTN